MKRQDNEKVKAQASCGQERGKWPASGDFFLKTASALMELNDHEKAKELLLAGPSSLTKKAVYWYDLARCQCRLGEVNQAKSSLRDCFERDKCFRAQALDDPDLEPVWD